ncbi:MAG: ABC transporter permease subunit [Planctomycetota bacterium]|nr:ABC transporter permease subunit [Planctomycetota bacterium]
MPIVSQATYRHPKTRALHAAIYVTLMAGALSMVYPFALMLAGSTQSGVDARETKIIPSFWADDAMLYRKHVEGLFNESLDAMSIAYGESAVPMEQLQPPAKPDEKLVADWLAFLEAAPPPAYASCLGYVITPVSRTSPLYLRTFKRHLAGLYGPDIESVNRRLGCDFVNWNAFVLAPEEYLTRLNLPDATALLKPMWDFKARQPRGMVYYFSPDGFYRRMFLQNKYSENIAKYNQAHGTNRASYAEVHLSRRLPSGTAPEREDWETFVRNSLNPLWIRADEAAVGPYREYLRAKYRTIDVLNRHYAAAYNTFDDVPPVDAPPTHALVRSDWNDFITGWQSPDSKAIHALPVNLIRVDSVDFQFRDYLQAKYKSIAGVNAATGASYADFMAITPPQRDAHYLAFLEMKSELRWEFLTRNYRAVVDYMVYYGRGMLNTVIYCFLAVLAALIVNPIAAYALSRNKMQSSYGILLFLLLTMAFPPMVTQIPSFLMLREFHLLNSFAALVLPGLASGYSIFLLKGFFDSQPRELYEAAQIDGASEWTIFWQITMSLAKPILSVIALGAFVGAYGNFMFALLICQDDRMWTLMVWLYQLQQTSGRAVVYASIVIASIPTFVVFVLCQRVILRGIIVPSEK